MSKDLNDIAVQALEMKKRLFTFFIFFSTEIIWTLRYKGDCFISLLFNFHGFPSGLIVPYRMSYDII